MGRNVLASKRIHASQKKTSATVRRAAERVFAGRGFAGTSMRDNSRASGVSQPLIQRYFKTKRDLYNEMAEVFLHGTLTQGQPKSGARRSSERKKGS